VSYRNGDGDEIRLGVFPSQAKAEAALGRVTVAEAYGVRAPRKGKGSVTKTKRGTWQVRYTHLDRRWSGGYYRTKEDAETVLADIVQSIKDKTWADKYGPNSKQPNENQYASTHSAIVIPSNVVEESKPLRLGDDPPGGPPTCCGCSPPALCASGEHLCLPEHHGLAKNWLEHGDYASTPDIQFAVLGKDNTDRMTERNRLDQFTVNKVHYFHFVLSEVSDSEELTV